MTFRTVSTLSFAACAVTATACFSAGSATAQAVELRYQVPPGTTAQVQESQTLVLAGQASDGWGNQQPIQQTFSGSVSYRLQVLDARGGVPSQVKVEFAPNLSFSVSDGQNPPQQQPLPFAGKSFTLTRQDAPAGGGGQPGMGGGQPGMGGGQGGASGGMGGQAPQDDEPWGKAEQDQDPWGQQPGNGNGNGGGWGVPAGPRVTVEPANTMDQESESFLHELMEFGWRDLLPGRSVNVGETWNPDASNYTRGLGLDPGGTVQITAQLASLGQANGRPTAELNLRLQINGAFDGLPMQGMQQGRATVDLATGMVLSAQLAGELPLDVQGPEGSLKGKASWQINRQVTNLQAGPAAGAAAGNGPNFAPPAIENQAGPSVNGQSPPPFAGTFTNDQLQLTLIEGQPRRIEIRRGDLVTPGRLTGNRDINMTAGDNGQMTIEVTFQGFFEHNGNEYDFSAEQPSPDKILFTTGKTTHELTLQRPAVKEEAGEPNPFE